MKGAPLNTRNHNIKKEIVKNVRKNMNLFALQIWNYIVHKYNMLTHMGTFITINYKTEL